MDRSRKPVRLRRRWIATLGVLVAFAIGPLDDLLTRNGRAEAPIPATHGPLTPRPATWVEAVLQTQKQGTPTVLIVTSKATPASIEMARLVLNSPAVIRLWGKVSVAELCAEEEPEQVNRLRVGGYPTFVAFRRSKAGSLEVAASYTGALSADELSGWVRGLGLFTGPAATASKPGDPGVTRAGFWPQKPAPSPSPQYPTPQYAPPPPPPPPAPAPTPPAPYVPREVYVEAPPVEREVVIEREVVVEAAPREVYIERPAPREVYIERAAPREAAPREVYIERAAPREAALRNVLTRPAAPREATPREAAPQPRTVILREAAPQPAPRTVMVREAAPREVYVERAAPREAVAPREVYVERAAAPRAITPRDTALIQPGPIARAVGTFGRSLARVGLPRVEVETETTYQIAAPREASVVTQAAPPPVYAAPPPVYVPPPPPPPYAPSPQAYPTPYAPSPQGR